MEGGGRRGGRESGGGRGEREEEEWTGTYAEQEKRKKAGDIYTRTEVG